MKPTHYARAYYGVDTITVARASSYAECEKMLERYKHERTAHEPYCLSGWMFWIERV